MATVQGTPGNDRLSGTNSGDSMFGLGGNDLLYGSLGNDSIDGGDGNDQLHGQTGNDTIDGGSGEDILYGSAGRDVLTGGTGNDTIYGGSGNDTFVFRAGDGDDIIYDFDSGENNGVVDTLRLVGFSLAQVGVSGPDDGVLSFNLATGDSVQLIGGDFDDISYTQVGNDIVLIA